MIKSMTGFGRSEYSDGKRNILIEIRAVNHRYCDISIRMQRRYSFAEEGIKSLVKSTAKRGKIDISVLIENVTKEDVKVKLNTPVAKQYYDNLLKLKDCFALSGDITLPYLAALPDVMSAMPDVENEEEILRSLSIPVKNAVENLDKMRISEGSKLADDIIQRGRLIQNKLRIIEERSPIVVHSYIEKMKERIKELLEGDAEVPEDRILLEAAIFADKSNITEELVRLDSHIQQMNCIISMSNEPDGRKLDFLVQEMNREANTIGSKSNDANITNLTIEIKSEIEKIREQVQNVE